MCGYGHFTLDMLVAIKPFLYRKVVWDLGCGVHGPHLPLLINCYFSQVVAVDKEDLIIDPTLPIKRFVEAGDYRFVQSLFKDIYPPEQIDTALISWPTNAPTPGLVHILEKADIVIYLGSNVDGSRCGSKALFQHLMSREVLVCVPNYKNTLMVYGKGQRVVSELWGEEKAFLDDEKIMSFAEAHP